MKKSLSKYCIVAFAVALALLLPACSDSGQASASSVQGTAQPQSETGSHPGAVAGASTGMGDGSIIGTLSAIDGSALTLALVGIPGGADGERPDMSGAPEGGEPPSGAQPPASGQKPPNGGGFESTGETKEIIVDQNTKITQMSSETALTANGLSLGAMLRVMLADDGQTATEIQVMGQNEGDAGK